MHFVHFIIDGAPATFRHEPCKDDELIDMIAFSYLGSSGQNIAAWLRLLKIFLGSKCIVTECDWGLRCGQTPSSQMCCSVFFSASGWRGRHGTSEKRARSFVLG